MSDSELSISRIGPESERLLGNLFEHYLHDMAEWFLFDTMADGSYGYDTASVWQNGYDAYLAKVGDSLAGFALIGSASEWLGDAESHDVHAFFVLRRFRRSGVGLEFATRLWKQQPGTWLVRVLETNKPALPFWRNAVTEFSGGEYAEERRVTNEKPWAFLRFTSDGA